MPPAELGAYGERTIAAVERFQRERGLEVDGVCGPQTWSSLVEAGYRLGDRLLYLRAPMLRGDDVSELQHRLGALGFDAGRVDGILGPDTERALRDFQRNMGLTCDGVCGRDTLAALARLRPPADDTASVGMAREREALRTAPRRLADRRLVIGETGGLPVLADALGRALQERGATVAVLHHPDPSEQASEANDFGGDVYVGIGLDARACCRAAYFAVPGFTSVGGRRLAQLICEELGPVAAAGPPEAVGARLAVLRETRMPAVACRIGPPERVVTRVPDLAAALADALHRWVLDPVD